MKQGRYAIMVLVFLLIFLVSCQEDKPDGQPQPEIKEDVKYIVPVASDSVDTEGMTKLREFSFDLDMDNTEENIELYTAAGRGEDGEMEWDDGQNWTLVIRDGDKSYPLLSQYVQLGVVYFTVSKSVEEQVPDINVIVSTGTVFSMMGYVFDNESSGYREELIYKSKENNWIYSSMPSY